MKRAVMWGLEQPGQEPDLHLAALMNHIGRLSAACDLGLVSAGDITVSEFDLILHYRGAIQKKHEKAAKKKGAASNAPTKKGSTSGLMKFMAQAKKMQEGSASG